MKFTANRTELADATRWVVRCIRNNPQLPILSGHNENHPGAFDYCDQQPCHAMVLASQRRR